MSNRRKTNPSRICKCCGVKIFNRFPNAEYCLDCADDVLLIKERITGRLCSLRKKFKIYNIKVRVKIKKDGESLFKMPCPNTK